MNPELRRNLWLEMSPHRLVAAPALELLVAGLLIGFGPEQSALVVAGFGVAAFVLLVLLWGTQLAGMSVLDEARARTWDAQRMSSIAPWTMTWGKLAGAPAFTWYAGLPPLALFVLFGWNTLDVPVLRVALGLLSAGILLHALALNGSVLASAREIPQRANAGGAMFLVAMVVIAPGVQLVRAATAGVQWWDAGFEGIDFLAGSAAVFAAWAVFGAWRSMCDALETRTLPWALPLFVLFAALYVAGFLVAGVPRAERPVLVLMPGVAIGLVIGYAMLFGERTGSGTWQRLGARLRARNWRRWLQELPAWLVALALAALFAVATVLLPAPRVLPAGLARLAPIGAVLFALRDAAIAQFFGFGPRRARVEAGTIGYIGLLYIILPGALGFIGADTLRRLLLPDVLHGAGIAPVLTVATQAVVAVALAAWRFRRSVALAPVP